jgi:ketosteroid isomerase-like protein
MSARGAAEAYVEAVNAADLARLSALFADDAVLTHALGTFTGRAAITAFYRDVILPAGVAVRVTGVAERGDECVVELEGRTPGGLVTRAVDRFTAGADGRIARLDITLSG